MQTRAQFIEKAVEAGKTVPPLTTGSLSIMGVPLPQIIEVLTVVWLVLLILGWLFDRFIAKAIAARKAKADASA